MLLTKYKILFFVPLLLISCKSKQVITEKISSRSDSSAVLLLEDEITQKEIQITSLQSELNRFKEENFTLRNEVSTHEINYDTSQPIDPQTQKPPVSAEIITISDTQLEKNLRDYEILLWASSIENENLTIGNKNLQYTIETLKYDNKIMESDMFANSLKLKWLLIIFLFVLIFILKKKYA